MAGTSKNYSVAFSLAGKLAAGFTGAFSKAASAFRTTEKGVQALNRAAADTSGLARQTAALNDAAKASEKMKKASQDAYAAQAKEAAARARSKERKERIGAGSIAGAAISGGLGIAGKTIIETGATYEAQMARVAAISGATGDSFKQLQNQARELGAATQFSATEAGQGMEYLAMAGYKTNEIMAAMPGLLNLAAASGNDLGSSADIASNILTGMGMQASQTGHLVDVLAMTTSKSNTNLTQLGEAFKYCATAAKGAGLDVETTAALLGKLADAGMQGSVGGTALAAALQKMANPSAKAQKILKKLGVTMKDSQGNLKSMPQVLGELNTAMANFRWNGRALGTAEIAQAYTELFGEQGARAANILKEQIANGSIEGLTEGLKHSDGTASKMAATMNNNLRGDMKELSSAWEELQLKLYDSSNGPMRGIVQNITSLVNTLNGWMQANPGLAKGIMEFGAALGVITAAMVALNIVAAMNPFVLIAGAVAAVAAGLVVLIANWDQAKAAILESDVVQGAIAQWEGFKAAVAQWGTDIVTACQNAKQWILDLKDNAINALVQAWGNVRSAALGVWDGLKEKAFGVINALIDKINGMIQLMNKVPGVNIGTIGHVGGDAAKSGGSGGKVPAMASGGVVSAPTLSLVGEAGPEAVIPLNKLDSVLASTHNAQPLGGITVSFSPVINMQGQTGESAYAQVMRGLNAGTERLKDELQRVLSDNHRLSYA